MIKNAQTWSHRDIEYLMPMSACYKAKPVEIVYPRVSIAAVFNGSKTLIGVALQHKEDKDNKALGQEAAMENALIKPVMVLNNVHPITEKAFDKFAWGLYEMYSCNLKPIAKYERPELVELLDEDDTHCCENGITWASTCPCDKCSTTTEPLKDPVYIY